MNILPHMSMTDWRALIINATRYAINRHTYASSEMAEILTRNAEHIPADTRDILIRDIEKEMERGAISQTDLPAWRAALARLKEVQA